MHPGPGDVSAFMTALAIEAGPGPARDALTRYTSYYILVCVCVIHTRVYRESLSFADNRSAERVEAAQIDGDLLLHVAKDPRLCVFFLEKDITVRIRDSVRFVCVL
jgi:hypothetical protein